jgi:hypothetical protein
LALALRVTGTWPDETLTRFEMRTETTGDAVIVLLTVASRWRDEVHCTESAEEP